VVGSEAITDDRTPPIFPQDLLQDLPRLPPPDGEERRRGGDEVPDAEVRTVDLDPGLIRVDDPGVPKAREDLLVLGSEAGGP